jgi:DNA-binding GntR family transcriptional regulator
MHTRKKIPARRRPASTETIVARITAALVEHRLPPGAKLGEEALGEIFGVSRTKVRQALNRLGQDKLVTLLPGRGAFVARPDAREARDLFDARRVLERTVIERFAAAATRSQLATLREHLARQRAAIGAGDVAARNRLLGEFHVVIAEMAGNAVITQLLSELVLRSSLVTLLYQSRRAASCSADEHAELIDAVRRGDASAAVHLMDDHLAHVERDLALPEEPEATLDLRDALAPLRA